MIVMGVELLSALSLTPTDLTVGQLQRPTSPLPRWQSSHTHTHTTDLQPLPELGLNNSDGSIMACPVLGSLYATMNYGDITIKGWIIVMHNLPRPLLSYGHMKQLRIIPHDYPQQIAGRGGRLQDQEGQVRQVVAPNYPTRKL